MNKLNREKRALILRCFTEGVGVNATARMADVSKNTVLKLLADLGPVCAAYQRQALVNLACKRVECDEIWAFCYAKEKNVPATKRNVWGYGDVWTWTAIDSDSKLVIAYRVDERDLHAAWQFMEDVASRLSNRVQLTTDGHRPYFQAVYEAFGDEIDYAMLQKIYGAPTGSATDRKYSPGECCGTKKDVICGKPDPRKISTSYVERLNLEIRTKNRRLTRLTNGFSRKVVNLEHSLAIGFMVYNFVRIHGSLKVTPAMEAKVTERLWSYEDVIGLLEQAEATGELQATTDSK
jgi:IS1 family transposase